MLKELTRHPVTGDTLHIDLLRVRLDQAISSTVVVELTGAEDAPGVKEGGVLEQVTREVNIEALPTDIPDSLELRRLRDAIGDTITLESLAHPAEVTLLDDPETVLVTLYAPEAPARGGARGRGGDRARRRGRGGSGGRGRRARGRGRAGEWRGRDGE